MKLLEGTRILARVGPEVILASEVMAGINEVIENNKDRIPADQLERQRELLVRQKLTQLIETKLIYLDARQTIPEENFPHVEESLGKQFEEVELKEMIQRAKVSTRRELDEKLRGLGTSLAREKRASMQRMLARQWLRQQVKFDEEITYDQMLDYYRDHAAEFEQPARARWREMMARFSKYPTKAAAGAAIAGMGNRVAAGAPFEQVAKAGSDGATAADGGIRDWTTKGSLVCKVLDRALFDPNLSPGQLSPILESEHGFHVILLTEREEARRTPFLEAQVEIQPKIKEERTKEQMRAYVLRLKEQIPVWTIFDDRNRHHEANLSAHSVGRDYASPMGRRGDPRR